MISNPNPNPKPSVSDKTNPNPNPKHYYVVNLSGAGNMGAQSAAPNYPDTKAKEKSHSGGSFFHECKPPTATAQTRRHDRSGRSYLPPATKRAAAMLLAIFETYAPSKPLQGPLTVTLIWTYPGQDYAPKATRPDLDNLAKLALDAATKSGYWSDDAQVVRFETAKFTGPTPGIYFHCTPFVKSPLPEPEGFRGFPDFHSWWRDIGSGLTPSLDDDMETHARRIASDAWNAAAQETTTPHEHEKEMTI